MVTRKDARMLKLGFIGAGKVGTALAVRLRGKGYPVVAVASRSFSSAERLAEQVEGCCACHSQQEVADTAELVFITTPDDAIAPVVANTRWYPCQRVIHCSGTDSLDILKPAMEQGALGGGFHPLQTFADVTYAIENLPGSTFALEATEPLLDELKQMAATLDGPWVELKSGDKVLYHIAAVFTCNYVVTLVKLACDLWQNFGLSTDEAVKSLIPLLRGTINNLENIGLPDCLTGPIARGDTGTIKKHLEVLDKRTPVLTSIYRELGIETIPISIAKGKMGVSIAENEQQAEELREILGVINN